MIGFIIVVFFILFLIGVFTSTQSAVNRAIYGEEPTIVNIYITERDGVWYDEEGNEVDEDGNII